MKFSTHATRVVSRGFLFLMAVGCFLGLAAVVGPASAQIDQSGSFTADLSAEQWADPEPVGPGMDETDIELITNGGFETGTLTGWTGSSWTVTTNNPHSGTYCAWNNTGGVIWQIFPQTDPNDITSASLWLRQLLVGTGAFQVHWGYTDGSWEYFYLTPTATWTQYNIATYLNLNPPPGVLIDKLRIVAPTGPSNPETSLDDVSVSTTPPPASPRKGPFLIYDGIPTQMRVRWQLAAPSIPGTNSLWWGLSPSSLPYTTYINASGTVFNCVIGVGNALNPALAPSTHYFYRIFTGGVDIGGGDFYSAPAANDCTISFIVYGDTRGTSTAPGQHNMVAQAIVNTYTAHPSYQTLIISVGDLVYDGTQMSYWDNQFFDHSAFPNINALISHMPYQSCIGNHDYPNDPYWFSRIFNYPLGGAPLTLPQRSWSFNYGQIHFVCLDQYNSSLGAMLTWLHNDLQANANQTWKFIYLHEPGWSAGGNHPNNVAVQLLLQPECINHNVQMVFAGHNHYYARAEVNGVQHITTGGGGAPLGTPVPNYTPEVVMTDQSYHFCKISINGSSLTFEAVRANGTTIETFPIPTDVSLADGGLAAGEVSSTPQAFELNGAYPNPFNPTTTINFTLPLSVKVNLTVYDVNGRELASLVNGYREAGTHEVTFDGSQLASGVYLYTLTAGEYRARGKMVLLK